MSCKASNRANIGPVTQRVTENMGFIVNGCSHHVFRVVLKLLGLRGLQTIMVHEDDLYLPRAVLPYGL